MLRQTETTPAEHAKRAAEAHTTLCVFGSIEGILGQNDIKGITAQKTAARIIALCKQEMAHQLNIYDREIANVG